jgi:shikimate dehydrogenase
VGEIVFIGVTTGSSLIHEAMAIWQPLLARPCGLRGLDIALDADDDTYATMLDDLRRDEDVLGAVVTVHKVRVLQAGKDRFSWLDPLAQACGEVNAIRRSDRGLHGWARDPVSAGRVVDRIWPDSEGYVVCLGAGGTALALAHYLFATRPPIRFICADPNGTAVDQLVRLAPASVEGHIGDGPWDNLVRSAPPGSLVINATGMGKDRPGSPITTKATFPARAVVWELNYRGQLEFLRLGRYQAASSGLHVHDGWQLFCHGWAAALTAVLDLPEDDRLGDHFAQAAQSLRPGTA